MKTFILDHQIPEPEISGVFSFLIRDSDLLDQVKEFYGRTEEEVVLKVFRRPYTGDITSYPWGWIFNPSISSPLLSATIAQNLVSFKELAPRVYALFLIEYQGESYPTQLVDYIEGEGTRDHVGNAAVFDQFFALGQEEHFTFKYRDIGAPNLIDGKWVDFQSFSISPDYQDHLRDFLLSHLWDKYVYQSVSELGITALRDTTHRIKCLGLDKIDFTGKNVLDVGCNWGMFCNYAASQGARRVVGLDVDPLIHGARRLSNYLGYFNIDYLAANVTEPQDINIEFDIVFYLSMYGHFGLPAWIPASCKELLVFELNNIPSEGAEQELQGKFDNIELIGTDPEYDNRKIYWCKKG